MLSFFRFLLSFLLNRPTMARFIGPVPVDPPPPAPQKYFQVSGVVSDFFSLATITGASVYGYVKDGLASQTTSTVMSDGVGKYNTGTGPFDPGAATYVGDGTDVRIMVKATHPSYMDEVVEATFDKIENRVSSDGSTEVWCFKCDVLFKNRKIVTGGGRTEEI
jgi:hypothetical protein